MTISNARRRMKTAPFTALLTLLLLLQSGCAGLGEKEPQRQSIGWDPAIHHAQLANGLPYFVVSQPAPVSPVSGQAPVSDLVVRLVVMAGSVDERDDELGVAHMLEHMVFHASDAFPAGLHEHFRRIGWMTGREVNAVTREELTQYFIRLSGTREQQMQKLPEALRVLSAIAGGASIRDEDWAQERNIVLEEWRRSDPERDRVNRARKWLVRDGAVSASRPTIGTENSIRTASAADIRAFYQRWYQPSNMALIITGDTDNGGVDRLVREYFAGLAQQHAVPPPGQRSARQLVSYPRLSVGVIERKDGLRVVDGFRAPIAAGNTAEDGLQRLYDTMLRKILRRQLVRQNDVLTGARISLTRSELTNDLQAVGFVWSDSSGADWHSALRNLRREIARVARAGVHPEDFAWARDDMLQAIERARALPPRDVFQWQDRIVNALLDERPLPEPQAYLNQLEQGLNATTLDDLNRMLRQRWLSSADRFFYLEGSDLGEVSDDALRHADASIRPQLNDTDPAPVPPKVEEVVAERELEGQSCTTPAAPTLIARDGDYSQWQLANGERLTYWRDARQGGLWLRGQSNAGYDRAGQQPQLLQAALQLGTQTEPYDWSDSEWQSWRQRHAASWMTSQNSRWLEWQLQSDKRGALAPALTLIDYWRARGEVGEEAVSFIREQGERVAKEDSNADTAQRQIARLRFAQSDDASITDWGQVARDDLSAGFRQQVRQPVHWYALAADDADKFAAQFSACLTQRPLADDAEFVASAPRTGQTRHRLAGKDPKRAEYQAYGRMPWQWNAESVVLLPAVQELLVTALKERLRQQLQGIYSARLQLEPDDQGENLLLSLSFTAAPERLTELADETNAVLRRIADDVSDQRLLQVLASNQRQQQYLLQQSPVVMSWIMASDGRAQPGDFRKAWRPLQPEHLRAVLREWSQPPQWQEFLIGGAESNR